MKSKHIELSECSLVNYLWSDLVENFGMERSKKLISQANDLQRMNGTDNITIPILFTGTGGSALISIDMLKRSSLCETPKGNQIVIFNSKKKLFQILHETVY